MNILGINPFHNGSICVLSDGKVIYYIEEERFSRIKYDELPFKSLLNIFSKYSIDKVAIAGLNGAQIFSKYSNKEIISHFLEKFSVSSKDIHYFNNIHHEIHAATAFYNSNFDEAIGIVIDAGGSIFFGPDNKKFVEQDSIFYCRYPNKFQTLYKNSTPYLSPSVEPLGIGQSFEKLCNSLGFLPLDGGKIMGLSSYGNLNNSIPTLFSSNNTDVNIVNNKDSYSKFFPKKYSKKWHKISSKITNLEKNLCWKLQTESQNILKKYIEKSLKQTNINNIVISGGYGLNCVANYYLKKNFPNVNFYFEPISHDGGTSIGAAKLLWYNETQDLNKHPQKSVYYGPKYSKKEILKNIKKYVDN